jgi:hypothetical protein
MSRRFVKCKVIERKKSRGFTTPERILVPASEFVTATSLGNLHLGEFKRLKKRHLHQHYRIANFCV